jgi:hypothetical protein
MVRMETGPDPLVSEVMPLHTTFKKMINDIQLSEVTATGTHPKECLKVLTQILDFIITQKNYQHSTI